MDKTYPANGKIATLVTKADADRSLDPAETPEAAAMAKHRGAISEQADAFRSVCGLIKAGDVYRPSTVVLHSALDVRCQQPLHNTPRRQDEPNFPAYLAAATTS